MENCLTRIGQLLEACLANPRLNPDHRAKLLFAFAYVLDARGEFQRAAELLREAHALRLRLNRGHRAYHRAVHEQFVNGLIRVFDRALFERVAEWGSDTERPVFIIGLPRSGTTLVEQILASHSQVHGAGELSLGSQSFDAVPTVLGLCDPPIDCVSLLNATANATLANDHLDRLGQLDGGRARRIVDKMPENYLLLGFLATLFPRATFIHCRRDLRDVAVSCWATDFRTVRWTNDPEHIASRVREYVA